MLISSRKTQSYSKYKFGNRKLLNNDITINARKFDGTIHKSWKADLIEESGSLLVFVGKFNKEIKHPQLGVIRRNTISYEYYWLNRWYNVFRFHEENGEFRNFYCNINMPPTFEQKTLDYVDLDLDIIVWGDYSYEVLDEDEFLQNAKKHNYSTLVKLKAYKNLSKLESLINSRSFPFNKIGTNPKQLRE